MDVMDVEESLPQQCFIGLKFHVPCHQTYLDAQIVNGYIKWIDVPKKSKDSIKFNLKDVNFEDDLEFCNHHVLELGFQGTTKAKAKCIGRDMKRVAGRKMQHKNGDVMTSVLKTESYFNNLQQNPYKILPGMRVCVHCVHAFKVDTEFSKKKKLEDPDWEPFVENRKRFEEINDILQMVGLEPLDSRNLGRDKLEKAAQAKVSDIVAALIEFLCMDDVVISNPFEKEAAKKVLACNDIVSSIKSTFQDNKSYRERIQLLTVLPNNLMTISETTKYFKGDTKKTSCTDAMVKKERGLRTEKGAFIMPPLKRGKKFPDERKQLVINFYEHEDNCEQLSADKKHVIEVTIDGVKQSKSKVLIRHTLRELYTLYTEAHPDYPLSYSLFCFLRPRWCMLSSARGVHNVCVCKVHGNVELMLHAVKSDYRELQTELIQTLVCDPDSLNCMSGLCRTCNDTGKDERRIKFHEKVNKFLQHRDTVRYAQWTSKKEIKKKIFKNGKEINRTSSRLIMVEEIVDSEVFLERLYDGMMNLLPHHIVYKIQRDAFKNQKKNCAYTTAVVLVDFAENWKMIIQNEASQLYFDNNVQATIHPFVAYVKSKRQVLDEDSGELKEEEYQEIFSSAVISDHMKHDTATFYSFQKIFLEQLKSKYPHIKHIEYWSDGCPGQYKNCFNFLNLVNHFADFELTANWNFSATSHGKNAADGIAACIKHSSRLAAYRRFSENFILTPYLLHKFCKDHHDWKIRSIWVPSHKQKEDQPQYDPEDHNLDVHSILEEAKLLERFRLAKTIAQTQMCHRVVVEGKQVKLYRTFTSDGPYKIADPVRGADVSEHLVAQPEGEETSESEAEDDEDEIVDDLGYEIGSFVGVRHHSNWFVCRIEETNPEMGTLYVTFMTTLQTGGFKYAKKLESSQYDIDIENVLCTISPPVAGKRSQYFLSKEDKDKIERNFHNTKS